VTVKSALSERFSAAVDPSSCSEGSQLQQLGIWTRTATATDARAHAQVAGLSMRAKDKLS